MSLKWTTTPPTEPGWYWLRFNPVLSVSPKPIITWVDVNSISKVMTAWYGPGYKIDSFVAYAGPIPQPQEPEGGE